MSTLLPAVHAEVHHTEQGTPYLDEPGVVMLARSDFNSAGMSGFLAGFDKSLDFSDWLVDKAELHAAERLCKLAGQLCYFSFGPKRTKNDRAGAYFDNIKQSGHGSVLEHASATFLFYGISRSLTHELVRHRAGFAYSQVSQRYCAGKTLRFVERPEYVNDLDLHDAFEERIDRVAADYEAMARVLMVRQEAGSPILAGDAARDLRKKVNGCARSLLPNETEAPIVTTANLRSWRHFLEMRASGAAEVEIRRLAVRVLTCLRALAPIIFDDYTIVELSDGTEAVETLYRKV